MIGCLQVLATGRWTLWLPSLRITASYLPVPQSSHETFRTRSA